MPQQVKRNTDFRLGQFLWIVLYIAANAAVFLCQAIRFAQNEAASDLLVISVAAFRGDAQFLNLNCSLVLLPMSRALVLHLFSWRPTVTLVATMSSMQVIHRCLGRAIIFWVLIHIGCHMLNIGNYHPTSETGQLEPTSQVAVGNDESLYSFKLELGSRVFSWCYAWRLPTP